MRCGAARHPVPPQILEKGSPYPLVILPQFGGYWIEDPENLGTPTSSDSSVCEEEEENFSMGSAGSCLGQQDPVKAALFWKHSATEHWWQ